MAESSAFPGFVDKLWRAIESRELAVFCGAGISLSSGLPLVHDFEAAVLERLQASEPDARVLLDAPLPFEAFVQVLQESSDISPLLSLFEIGAPNPTHLFLAELAKAGYVRTLCTTNFDRLIERALEQVGLVRDRDFEVLYRDEDLGRAGASDARIRVVKVHGSIDDKPGMAITLKQVAGRTLVESRRQVIDAVFAGPGHQAVLVLGYSCSDLFDLSPQIEAIEAGHRRVILVDHQRSREEVRDLAGRQEKNPFRRFPHGDWMLCDTDALVASLRRLGGLDTPPPVDRADRQLWLDRVDTWARAANQEHAGTAASAILGELFFKISGFADAERHYGRALEVARAAGDRQREGTYLGNVANSEHHLGKVEAAVRHYQEAIAIARELGDTAREGMWLCNLGGILTDAGDHDQAIDVLQEGLAISRQSGDLSGEAYCLGNLGHVCYLTARYEEAAACFRSALDNARVLGDKAAEASLVGSLGDAGHRLGQYRAALGYHEEALAYARQVADRAAESNWRGKIANDCLALGDVPRAIEELERAIVLARSLGDRRGEAARLGDLGNLYQTQGQPAQAKELYEQALRIAREIGHAPFEGTCLGNLGNLLMAEEQYAEAIAYYEQALESAVRSGNQQLEGTWLGNLGAAWCQLGDDQRAVALHERSLEIATAIGDASRMGDAEFNLGSAKVPLGEIEEAAGHFRRAMEIYTSLFGPEHPRTRRAKANLEELEPAMPNSLFWMQVPSGNIFELYTASGKRMVPVFTKGETAMHVRRLLAERFPETLQIVQADELPRETFEEVARADGVPAEAYLFIYEDSPEFPRFLAGLEAYPPQQK